MRRIVIISTALAVLGGVAAAYAAGGFNKYAIAFKFNPSKAGSPSKPVPVSYTQDFAVTGTGGNRTAVLLNVTTRVSGLKDDLKDFPTCSPTVIHTGPNDGHCPPGALLATGSITALLAPSNNPSTSAPRQTPCAPLLHAWSGGGNAVWFYFLTAAGHQCGGLPTGATPPYKGTIGYQGGSLVLNLPIPTTIDFPTGTGPGALEGELISEHLTWLKRSKTVHGKTVAEGEMVGGCKHGKRAYSVSFTSVRNGVQHTDTAKSSANCS